ncbi:MAG: deoxyribose-phosphate aldolase [Bacilli bacterium]|nr:deoxyribose-phosphate aldolase [Bacilli bacterium]
MKYNKFFDHTCLKADATLEDIKSLCLEARAFDFASVCVNPFYVPVAKRYLKGSNVMTCTVVGFPLGQMSPAAKAMEAKDAVNMGADEVDMVINVSMAKAHDYEFIKREIAAVKEACGLTVTLKVILEICYLTPEEIKGCCKAAKAAGADFVKTSTGFGKGGATVEAVEIMRKTVGPDMGVKAAGGIRDKKTFLEMVRAGATRIGCSSSVAIYKALKND